MRRTIWTVLLAVVVQLLASSAWGLVAPQRVGAAPHCHEVVMPDAVADTSDAEALQDQPHAPVSQGDSHHCCAVGLGCGLQPTLSPAPQAKPDSVPRFWVSLSPRPDLRPPI